MFSLLHFKNSSEASCIDKSHTDNCITSPLPSQVHFPELFTLLTALGSANSCFSLNRFILFGMKRLKEKHRERRKAKHGKIICGGGLWIPYPYISLFKRCGMNQGMYLDMSMT
jgi:hypothetical protein